MDAYQILSLVLSAFTLLGLGVLISILHKSNIQRDELLAEQRKLTARLLELEASVKPVLPALERQMNTVVRHLDLLLPLIEKTAKCMDLQTDTLSSLLTKIESVRSTVSDTTSFISEQAKSFDKHFAAFHSKLNDSTSEVSNCLEAIREGIHGQEISLHNVTHIMRGISETTSAANGALEKMHEMVATTTNEIKALNKILSEAVRFD